LYFYSEQLSQQKFSDYDCFDSDLACTFNVLKRQLIVARVPPQAKPNTSGDQSITHGTAMADRKNIPPIR
jgi:hypothetical protein